MSLTRIAKQLSKAVDALSFEEPVAYVYNPLDYAWGPVKAYLERFGGKGREALFLGMNPGPWGMVQTGVPFGEIELARDWMGLEGKVGKPAREHPKRPVEGFACTRSEVSGKRLWGWARDRFGTPEAFFARFFVWNYCPLAFLEEGGRNRTPDKLPVSERQALEAVCDDALRKVVAELEVPLVIGVGAFAESRAKACLGDSVRIGRILHPSPASPIANRGWSPRAEAELAALGIELDGASAAG